MKLKMLTAAALVAASTAVHAADVQITFDDKSQQVSFQLPALLDQCVSGMTLRADATACRSVSSALTALASMVSQAQKAAADKAAAEAKAKTDKAAETPAP